MTFDLDFETILNSGVALNDLALAHADAAIGR